MRFPYGDSERRHPGYTVTQLIPAITWYNIWCKLVNNMWAHETYIEIRSTNIVPTKLMLVSRPLDIAKMIQVRHSVIRKNPLKYSAMTGNWNRPPERANSEIQFILPLSYHDWPGTWREQRDTFILPSSYHDPAHREGRQWNTIHSPTELSWLTWDMERTAGYIHSPTELSWLTRDMERTEGYIHSPTELSWRKIRRLK